MNMYLLNIILYASCVLYVLVLYSTNYNSFQLYNVYDKQCIHYLLYISYVIYVKFHYYINSIISII